MFTPSAPSSPQSPGGSQRYRQPSRHPTTSASPIHSTGYDSVYLGNSNPQTPKRATTASTYGGRSGSRGRREERTIVGTGTVGCGPAWEAQQAAAKEQHLETWEGKKATQKQQELLKEQAQKFEDEKKMKDEKEMKRRMFAENRFTTIEYSQRRPNNSAGMDPNGGSPPPPPIVRNRSAAERRERNILPASATSPLRYRHFTAVVAETQAFQKERQSWEEARKIEHKEHEAYIQRMRGNSPPNNNNNGTSPSGADGVRGGTRADVSGQQQLVGGGADGSADGGVIGSGNNNGNNLTGGYMAGSSLSPLRLSKLPTIDNSGHASQNKQKRETRSSSPPTEVSQQCRKEVLEQRAANKAEVELQKEQELLKHKELRHAVVTSHFNTFKSVRDLGISKNTTVNKLRKESVARGLERQELVKAIEKDKHDTFARQRKEQAEQHEKTRYVTAHENRRRVLQENEEERKRVEARNQIKEKELDELKASADARRMLWAGSTPEHRKSAERHRQNNNNNTTDKIKGDKANGGFSSSRMPARGASRQTDDGPVEVYA